MFDVIQNFSQSVNRLSQAINRKFFVLAAVAVALMAIPTFLDVCFRLFFSRSVLGAIELVEFLQVVLVFGALAFVQDKRGHIKVTLVFDKLSAPVQACLHFFTSGSSLILFGICTLFLWNMGMEKWQGNEASMMLGIPVAFFVFFATLGAALLTFSLLGEWLDSLNTLLQKRQFFLLLVGFVFLVVMVSLPFLLKGTPLAENLLVLGSVGMAFLMLLLVLGMPIGFAMAAVGYMGMIALYPNMNSANSMLGLTPYAVSANYVYSVVPMFILMGELATHSGISRDLFHATNVWLGNLPGGLAIASISGCAGFAAVSGDSMATAVTMASVALPEMRKHNYDPGLACATLAAGGTLGILIPPSTGFIFYALVTEESVGKLFVAGIIPGILMTALFIAILYFYAKRYPHLAPRGEKTTFSAKLDALRGVVPMVALIILILGGILAGYFSPNEGGAVGAVGTLSYAVARRRLSWCSLFEALKSTAFITASLLIILIGVGLLSYFFAATALPFELADLIIGMEANRYVVLLAIVVLYIVLGCLMNVLPMILLTLPAIFPTVVSLGFDPIWFGVVTVILMEMGQITPPVGINVFALSTVATDVPMASIYRRILPFFFGMLTLVLILTLFPALATWLPELLF